MSGTASGERRLPRCIVRLDAGVRKIIDDDGSWFADEQLGYEARIDSAAAAMEIVLDETGTGFIPTSAAEFSRHRQMTRATTDGVEGVTLVTASVPAMDAERHRALAGRIAALLARSPVTEPEVVAEDLARLFRLDDPPRTILADVTGALEERIDVDGATARFVIAGDGRARPAEAGRWIACGRVIAPCEMEIVLLPKEPYLLHAVVFVGGGGDVAIERASGRATSREMLDALGGEAFGTTLQRLRHVPTDHDFPRLLSEVRRRGARTWVDAWLQSMPEPHDYASRWPWRALRYWSSGVGGDAVAQIAEFPDVARTAADLAADRRDAGLLRQLSAAVESRLQVLISEDPPPEGMESHMDNYHAWMDVQSAIRRIAAEAGWAAE